VMRWSREPTATATVEHTPRCDAIPFGSSTRAATDRVHQPR
jgi:hypothetical protein